MGRFTKTPWVDSTIRSKIRPPCRALQPLPSRNRPGVEVQGGMIVVCCTTDRAAGLPNHWGLGGPYFSGCHMSSNENKKNRF